MLKHFRSTRQQHLDHLRVGLALLLRDSPGVDVMTFDGTNQYLYDAESRVCAVLNTNTGQITQYLYDAEGHRVAKGHPATNSSTLYCPTGRADFTPDETYIVGQNGEQVSELDGNGACLHRRAVDCHL